MNSPLPPGVTAESMNDALQRFSRIVGSEWVTGVIAPITPNGACSITARP